MLKKITAAFISVIMVMILTGCQNNGAPSAVNSDENTVTFTDDLGREVTVSNPQRTAALLGSFADVWYLAGGTVCAAPDDAWEDFELSLPEDAVNLGMTKDLSLELLFSSSPDFIIASSNTKLNLDWLDTLNESGIPTAYFNVSDFESYLNMLNICTDITRRKDLYQTYGLDVKTKIDEIKKKSAERISENGAPSVISLRASASYIRAKNSQGNVLGEMLKDLGCVNIADSNGSLLEDLSIEYIVQSDPDYIFFVQSGDDTEGTQKNVERFIEENPAWNSLTAVKEGRVYFTEKRLYNLKPNALWGEAYEKLENILSGVSS